MAASDSAFMSRSTEINAAKGMCTLLSGLIVNGKPEVSLEMLFFKDRQEYPWKFAIK
jgi:hypothetical protein